MFEKRPQNQGPGFDGRKDLNPSRAAIGLASDRHFTGRLAIILGLNCLEMSPQGCLGIAGPTGEA